MRINRRRFLALSLSILIAHVLAVGAFLWSRPRLDADGWAFLERQRPRLDADGATFFIVQDGLNFALARRPIGGWEPASVRLFQSVNLPAYSAALATFHGLQGRSGGSSKLHSDLATIVFAVVAVIQWGFISALLSLRRVPREGAAA